MKLFQNDNSRTNLIQKNVAASFLLKFVGAAITLLLVPLTLACLGEYQNGIWLTISSMLVWIDQMDIGLGNGLRNKLTVYVAQQETEKARGLISSTMVMLLCITGVLMVILSLLIETTDIFSFLNVDESRVPELRTALMAAVILVCMTFSLKFISNVYLGMQLPAMSNLILVLGQGLAMTATWMLLQTGHATFLNVVIVNTAAPLLTYLVFYPITFYVKYPSLRPSFRLANLREALSLANIGVRFFWLQIASVVQFMTANILISKFFSPEMVTPYQITYRYFSIVLVAFSIISVPYWNATTDAYARGDMLWIAAANRRMRLVTLSMAAALALMTLVSPFVYNIWIGDKCHVPYGMTVMMAIYIFLLVDSTRYSYFLNGIGALRLQLYMTVMVVVFIPLAWFVSHVAHDIIYFMAVMCVCLIPSIVVNKIQFHKILKGKAVGLWRI